MCFAKSLMSNNKLFQGHPVFLGYREGSHSTRREKLRTVAETIMAVVTIKSDWKVLMKKE